MAKTGKESSYEVGYFVMNLNRLLFCASVFRNLRSDIGGSTFPLLPWKPFTNLAPGEVAMNHCVKKDSEINPGHVIFTVVMLLKLRLFLFYFI